MRRSSLFVASILCTVVPSLPAPAAAERLVLYIQERLGREAVLVPLLTRARTGSALVDRVGALFARLKREKPHVYGKAALDLSSERATELERSRIVSVELDPDRPRTREEVIAEVVYTFTAAGARAVRVSVRGETGKLYTRDDVPVGAFVLTVPLWLGLPPSPFPDALVRLPGGEVASVADLEKRLGEGQPALIDAVVALLKDGRSGARLRAVRALGHLPAATSRSRLLALLQDRDPRLRAAAADGLAAQRSPEVVSAMERLLAEDRDDEVRGAAARALMQSGQPDAAAKGVAFLLKSPDSRRKVELLRGLKGSRLTGMVGALMPVLADPSPAVRSAALEALGGINDPKLLEAVAALAERDRDRHVREDAAKMLVRSGEPRFVAKGLAHELTSGDEERAASAAQQLGGLGVHGRAPLEAALSRGPSKVRAAAAQALQRVGDPASLAALARAAQDGLREAAIAAAAVLGQQPPAELAKLIESGDVDLKRLAVAAARDAKGSEIQQALIRVTRDRDRVVRLGAAEALGRMPGAGVVAALSPMLEDEDDRVRKVAADGLAAIGDPEARPALMKLVKYGNTAVRQAVFRALARLQGAPPREAVGQLLEALYDEDAGVREHAIAALSSADRKDRRIVPVVRLQLKDAAAPVRRAAVRAIGTLGDAKVVSALEDALGDSDAGVRIAAVEALEQVGGAAAAAALEKHAASEKDGAIAARAREAAAKVKAQ